MKKKGRKRVVAIITFRLKATSWKKCNKEQKKRGKIFLPLRDYIVLFICQRKTALCWWCEAFIDSVLLPELGVGWFAEISPASEANLIFLPVRSFILWGFILLVPMLIISKCRAPILCKSLPPDSLVLLGHPRFQKEYVIVAGTR